jgi:anaerobic selenocysteine-containing dehydrogenase
MTDWTQTACILCECNCGIEVQLDGRRLERIRGDKAHPGSQGYTCNKAMRLDLYQNGPHRLTSPMRRRPDGSHEEIDWDTAIAEIAAGFKRVADEHGGESILYYGGGGQGNHLGGSYSGAFLRALGSRYRSSALAQEKTGEGWVENSLYGSHTRGEFEHAEVSVFIGKNPWMSQSFPRARVVLREISRDPERSMIVIDPVVTDTAKLADLHLRVRPGTDAWCLAAMVGILVQEDLVDQEFLARARKRSRRRARAFRPGRRVELCRLLRGRRGPHPRRRPADRKRRQRVRVRGPRHPAGTEQHALLVREPDAVDPDRELRQPRRDAPPHVVRELVPRPACPPHARHR